VGNSYVVNLCKVASLKLSPANVVRHMTFLHGYTEPLLLLLHETKPTWGGRCVWVVVLTSVVSCCVLKPLGRAFDRSSLLRCPQLESKANIHPAPSKPAG
jgi:hypothetical protein